MSASPQATCDSAHDPFTGHGTHALATSVPVNRPARSRGTTLDLAALYEGRRKTHLGHIAVAAAINLVRLTSFLRGEVSEQIRTSAFKRAMKQVA